MSFRKNILCSLILPSILLAGCGGSGSSDFGVGNGNGGDFSGGGSGGGTTTTPEETTPDTSDPTTGTTNVSFTPLSVYEAYQSFSGFPADGLFQGSGYPENVRAYFINPIDSTTLASIGTAQASDFTTTIDDVEIDPLESHPILQRVIGGDMFLRTALVFDLSQSSSSADISALIVEAKAYIAEAQANADPVIAQQEFVVWAFGQDIEELTSGFTNNTATINTALDLVVTRSNSQVLGTSSNLHRAILQSIGRYIDTGVPYDFSVDGDNDLIDMAQAEFIVQSQLVLFSSGQDSYLEVTSDLMVQAIQSQGIEVFDESTADTNDTKFLNKPLFYYVLGGATAGSTYQTLSEEAETTTDLTLSAGAYSFSSGLISNQQSAIAARVDLDNRHLYRYAFLPRIGDHTVLFKTDATGSNYSFTTSIKDVDLDPNDGSPAEELASLVEITGPNGEYLANNEASLAEIATFAPATRWVNDVYAAGDYSWTIPSGNGTGTLNADGSFTITAITAATVGLQLENTVTGHIATITLSD